MTTAEAAVATLAQNGIDTLYCLPGVQNDQLFDAFHKAQDRIRPIHTRHEQGCAYMALGAALASGRPTVIEIPAGQMPDPWPLLRMPRNRAGSA
jgi:acetolactate synthase-1/2/3 large subunit